MNPPPVSFVVDAGVALKLVLPEPLADRAQALFSMIEGKAPAVFHVPDLFYIECANTLWKRVRRGDLTEADAHGDAARLGALTLSVMSTAALMKDGLHLAIRHGISAYDACYVALADRLGVKLMTADEWLVRKLAGSGHQVEWLGTFAPPSPPVS
jgi:predicted nucleic acid-binding protein